MSGPDNLAMALGADAYWSGWTFDLTDKVSAILTQKPCSDNPAKALSILQEMGGSIARAAEPFLKQERDPPPGSDGTGVEFVKRLTEASSMSDAQEAAEAMLSQIKAFGRRVKRIGGSKEILDPWYWLLGEGYRDYCKVYYQKD